MVASTYTNGYDLIAIRNISKRDFIKLLDLLKIKFNEFYNDTNYSFAPERISEGGIIFCNFLGQDPGLSPYKTMRLYKYFVTSGKESLYDEEWIDDNTIENWRENDEILINRHQELGTFLKSFNGAPIWTIKELNIFEECFNEIGIIREFKYVKYGKYPTKSSLSTDRR